MLYRTIALLAACATTAQAGSSFDKFSRSHLHHHAHRHHRRTIEIEDDFSSANETEEIDLTKRSSQCAFPYGSGMVAITPDDSNAGWAMSPDQPCTPGNYCPFACQPGMLMDQWDPAATTYSYPESMYGGLYCNTDGSISKPFPSRDYCKQGVASVNARNAMGASVAFCQTVLPGNEAMLIPTAVGAGSITELAVPDTTYWAGTAAHYYINPAGVSTAEGCVWGTNAEPWGNWAPFVAGANTDASGITYVKVGWNPIYTEDPAWSSVLPTWAVSIECNGSGCVGLPCRCDPSIDGYNQCNTGSDGAGGAAFCVATVPAGSSANIVVYDTSSGAGSSSNAVKAQFAVASVAPVVSTTPVPTTTSTTTTSTSTTTTSTSTTTTTTSTTTTSTSTSTSTSTTTTSTTTSSSIMTTSTTSRSTLMLAATNSTRTSSSMLSGASVQASYLNITRSNIIVSAAATPTLLHGGQGYDNLVASASASASTKSGGDTLAKASPLLVFVAGVIVLMRL